jgi:hypothetical protein
MTQDSQVGCGPGVRVGARAKSFAFRDGRCGTYAHRTSRSGQKDVPAIGMRLATGTTRLADGDDWHRHWLRPADGAFKKPLTQLEADWLRWLGARSPL